MAITKKNFLGVERKGLVKQFILENYILGYVVIFLILQASLNQQKFPNENSLSCSAEQTCLNASESWTILCRELLCVQNQKLCRVRHILLCLTSKP